MPDGTVTDFLIEVPIVFVGFLVDLSLCGLVGGEGGGLLAKTPPIVRGGRRHDGAPIAVLLRRSGGRRAGEQGCRSLDML